MQFSIMVGPMSLAALKEMCPPETEIRMGDTKIIFDSTKPDEVDAARATFNKLTGKGYRAFKAEGEKGIAGTSITEFDPKAERLIFVPRIAGGC